MTSSEAFVFWGPFVAFGLILAGYGVWIWWSER